MTVVSLRLSSILSGLSYALDLTEGHPRGHSSRSCLIGMRILRSERGKGLWPEAVDVLDRVI